jgi:hypothetical protein
MLALRRFVASRLPNRVRTRLRSVRVTARRRLRPARRRDGWRLTPISDVFGSDRGTPIDRFYIADFLARHSTNIKGRVLEVGERRYTEMFGGGSVEQSHIVDIDASNPLATIVGDLATVGSVPASSYDCFILTQSLQYVRDPLQALSNAWQSIASGGALLISVPCLSRLDPVSGQGDLWRFTPPGLSHLISRACPESEPECVAYGNLLCCTAFLMGLAAEELRDGELEYRDENFPLTACALVRKSP